jgi:hypothetical protein
MHIKPTPARRNVVLDIETVPIDPAIPDGALAAITDRIVCISMLIDDGQTISEQTLIEEGLCKDEACRDDRRHAHHNVTDEGKKQLEKWLDRKMGLAPKRHESPGAQPPNPQEGQANDGQPQQGDRRHPKEI